MRNLDKMFGLHKSKKILIHVHSQYIKRKKKLLPAQAAEIEAELKELEQAIVARDVKRAQELATDVRNLAKNALRKSPFEQARDFVLAIAFALVFALIIRQVWFEPYEIPTGSMRPTFKEQDHLVVSKTTFGINIPFTPRHFYFDPNLVKRSEIIVFTTENMDVRDADTLYFYLFPGKKQFVKRMMGKPGDTLYFYGGQIYGIDRDGQDISSELQLKQLASIDHIPFIRFEGNIKVSEPFRSAQGEGYRNAILHQMNSPVSLLTVLSDHRLEGEMLSLSSIRQSGLPAIKQYGDLWGIKNYATARILNSEQMKNVLKKTQLPGDAQYYLELRHNPSLNALKLSKDQWGRLRPRLELSKSYIPLKDEHLKALFKHLYTARFVVKNGFARRYAVGEHLNNSYFLPKMKGIPDGTYEFYNGIGYKIKFGGTAIKLDQNHPLMQFSPENMQLFFNLGIHFDTRAGTNQNGELFETERYAYFRNGNLYLLGAPIYATGDPTLADFLSREQQKVDNSTPQNPYIPFVDLGPPSPETIKEFGLLIPEKMYLALGDNYAMSADSREFGFVPEGNLRGSPAFIFWPFGSRFALPNQPSTAIFTLPNVIVWGLALIVFLAWRMHHRRKYRFPLQYK